MSQDGPLNEEEVRKYLNDTFNLKLDKDALTKPTREFVVYIYTRFLDESNCRRALEELKNATIVGWIRARVSHYNVGYVFEMRDLYAPIRKRTVAFLNVLIFLRAQWESELVAFQQSQSEWEVNQAEFKKVDQLLAQKRLESEDLAIKKANSRPSEELRNGKSLTTFEEEKRRGDTLVSKKNKIKDVIDARRAVLQAGQEEKLDEVVAGTEGKLQFLNQGPICRKKLPDLRQTLSRKAQFGEDRKKKREAERLLRTEREKFKVTSSRERDLIPKESQTKLFTNSHKEREAIQAQIDMERSKSTHLSAEDAAQQEPLDDLNRTKAKRKVLFKTQEEQLRMDMEGRISYKKQFERHSASGCEQKKSEMDLIKKKRAESLTRRASISNQYQAFEDEANKELDKHLKTFQKMKRNSQEASIFLDRANEQIEALLGKPTEVEMPVNRTYIKESK